MSKALRLSTNQKITLTLSALAVLISLGAVFVQFDTPNREYRERGFLLETKAMSKSEYNYYSPDYTGPRWEAGAVETLVNAGKRPIQRLEIFVTARGDAQNPLQVKVEGHPVEQVRESDNFTVFGVVGAIAPDEKFVIHYRGKRDVSVTTRTEHGDRLDIMWPSKPQSAVDGLIKDTEAKK